MAKPNALPTDLIYPFKFRDRTLSNQVLPANLPAQMELVDMANEPPHPQLLPTEPLP